MELKGNDPTTRDARSRQDLQVQFPPTGEFDPILAEQHFGDRHGALFFRVRGAVRGWVVVSFGGDNDQSLSQYRWIWLRKMYKKDKRYQNQQGDNKAGQIFS